MVSIAVTQDEHYGNSIQIYDGIIKNSIIYQ